MASWAGTGCAGHKAAGSIIFVLGEDRHAVNPYYARAEACYRQQHAPNLVTHCRSLRAVCDHLVQHRPPAGPWDSVHLVVHGNAWTGMDLPVLPGDSTRTTPATLAAATAAGQLPPLPDRVVNGSTVIVLHGCALGRDTALLLALSRALGGADGQCPRIVSTQWFNLYESNGNTAAVRQTLARFWYVNYPTNQRPPDSLLARKLTNKHPDTDLDWAAALRQRRPRWTGDVYWRLVVVPVHWAVTYPDSAARPALHTLEDQQRWLAAQPELQAAVARMGLSVAGFRWTFREETLHFDDGAAEPAIVAEGKTSVCCVLREAPAGSDQRDWYTSAQFKRRSWPNFLCLQ